MSHPTSRQNTTWNKLYGCHHVVAVRPQMRTSSSNIRERCIVICAVFGTSCDKTCDTSLPWTVDIEADLFLEVAQDGRSVEIEGQLLIGDMVIPRRRRRFEFPVWPIASGKEVCIDIETSRKRQAIIRSNPIMKSLNPLCLERLM